MQHYIFWWTACEQEELCQCQYYCTECASLTIKATLNLKNRTKYIEDLFTKTTYLQNHFFLTFYTILRWISLFLCYFSKKIIIFTRKYNDWPLIVTVNSIRAFLCWFWKNAFNNISRGIPQWQCRQSYK